MNNPEAIIYNLLCKPDEKYLKPEGICRAILEGNTAKQEDVGNLFCRINSRRPNENPARQKLCNTSRPRQSYTENLYCALLSRQRFRAQYFFSRR